MRPLRLLFGVVLGLALVGAAWFGGWVLPPEGLARRVAALEAVYPGPVGEAEVERIECAPLRRLRLYLVCTADCGEVRRLVAVKGLRPTLLANLNRVPPEDVATTRGRINTAVGREAMRLDADGARLMIACYLRLEGLHPALVLSEGGASDVEAARLEGEEAMQRLAEGLDEAEAVARIPVEPTPEGYTSDLLYWDTWRVGHPILRLTVRIARDGQMRWMHAVQIASSGSTVPGEGAGAAPSTAAGPP